MGRMTSHIWKIKAMFETTTLFTLSVARSIGFECYPSWVFMLQRWSESKAEIPVGWRRMANYRLLQIVA